MIPDRRAAHAAGSRGTCDSDDYAFQWLDRNGTVAPVNGRAPDTGLSELPRPVNIDPDRSSRASAPRPRGGAQRPGAGQIRSERQVTSSRTMRAGLPAATQCGGTVPVTTACAPMMALSPMTEPLSSVAWLAIQT